MASLPVAIYAEQEGIDLSEDDLFTIEEIVLRTIRERLPEMTESIYKTNVYLQTFSKRV